MKHILQLFGVCQNVNTNIKCKNMATIDKSFSVTLVGDFWFPLIGKSLVFLVKISLIDWMIEKLQKKDGEKPRRKQEWLEHMMWEALLFFSLVLFTPSMVLMNVRYLLIRRGKEGGYGGQK